MQIWRIGFVLLAACLVPAIAAPAQNDNRSQHELEELYAGVVVDQTITVAGQDFYQYFIVFWRDKPLSERYAISIHERPSARWGNQVWIEYAQRRVFQTILPTSRAAIKPVSEQAADIAYQNVVDTDVQRLLFRDLDIGPDEM